MLIQDYKTMKIIIALIISAISETGGFLIAKNVSPFLTNSKLCSFTLNQKKRSTSTQSFTSLNNQNESLSKEVPPFVQSIVLRQVYPAIMQHIEQFGNPNIPLGTVDGKRCKTLRRLVFEQKLTDEEIDLLEKMNFRFNSFEDVYDEADFDDCLRRLIE